MVAVTGVEGRVLKSRPGSQAQTVRAGDVLVEGDTLTIAAKGKARVSGDAGINLGMGPGEYQLADSEACERLFQSLAPVAEGPLPVKVKEGEVTQTIGDEIGAIIEAGKDLFLDGIFRNLRRGAAAGGVTKYVVDRSARRKRTETCARRGQIRVYTTDPDVAPGKRELVLSAGQCALTKDGGAPRRVKSGG